MGRKPRFTPEHVLKVIQEWMVENTQPPTLDELAKKLEVESKRTVHRYLEILEAMKLIERGTGARAIRILKGFKSDIETVRVPLVGTAPAGTLMTAEENIEGWFELPRDTLRPPSGKFFMLRVKGTSMNQQPIEGRKIDDGDLILVRQQQGANNNDVVVALIDGKATIKKLIQKPDYWILMARSDDKKNYPPIVLDEEARVQGVVCRVFKDAKDLRPGKDS